MQIKNFNYRPVSLKPALNRAGGFTLIEILVVTFIFTIIVGSLMVTLNSGQFSSTVGSARVELQAKLRNIMGLIVRDVRQTKSVEINNNDPRINHIKFKKVTGVDVDIVNKIVVPIFDTHSIDYEYIPCDAVVQPCTLKRTFRDASDNILQETDWSDITQSPFYVAPGVPLAANNILTNRKLFIVIKGITTVRGRELPPFILSEEVKIRNE